MGVKSNFENFSLWVMPITKFALVMITVHQFQKLRRELCIVFSQKFVSNILLFHISETHFFNLLRPLSLRFCKIKRNFSSSMIVYLCLFCLFDWAPRLPPDNECPWCGIQLQAQEIGVGNISLPGLTNLCQTWV